MTASDFARILRAAADEAERIAAETAEAAPQGADELLPLRECGPSVRTLRAAIHAGALPAVWVGREYQVRRSDLDAWLEARRVLPRERIAPARQMTAAERAIERAQRSGQLRVVGAS